jgi:hypothetical protein
VLNRNDEISPLLPSPPLSSSYALYCSLSASLPAAPPAPASPALCAKLLRGSVKSLSCCSLSCVSLVACVCPCLLCPSSALDSTSHGQLHGEWRSASFPPCPSTSTLVFSCSLTVHGVCVALCPNGNNNRYISSNLLMRTAILHAHSSSTRACHRRLGPPTSLDALERFSVISRPLRLETRHRSERCTRVQSILL